MRSGRGGRRLEGLHIGERVEVDLAVRRQRQQVGDGVEVSEVGLLTPRAVIEEASGLG